MNGRKEDKEKRKRCKKWRMRRDKERRRTVTSVNG
jgi:hypothetical protein